MTRSDLGDLAVLSAMRRSQRDRSGRRTVRQVLDGVVDAGSAEARCRDLVARCLLVADPRAPAGVTVSLLGESRLQRFIRSPVGSAAPAAYLCEECAVRRMVLDALDPDDREDLAGGMCRDLVAMRGGLMSCAHAEACASRACPLAAVAFLEEIDMALVWLSQERAGAPGPERPA